VTVTLASEAGTTDLLLPHLLDVSTTLGFKELTATIRLTQGATTSAQCTAATGLRTEDGLNHGESLTEPLTTADHAVGLLTEGSRALRLAIGALAQTVVLAAEIADLGDQRSDLSVVLVIRLSSLLGSETQASFSFFCLGKITSHSLSGVLGSLGHFGQTSSALSFPLNGLLNSISLALEFLGASSSLAFSVDDLLEAESNGCLRARSTRIKRFWRRAKRRKASFWSC